MVNPLNHLKTVNKHRYEVLKLCMKCGIPLQGIVHDLSKYSPSEFIPSIHYWTGKISPIDVETEKKGYSTAWLHHKGRNKHHYEYWLDPIHCKEPTPMPRKYLAEMFCDRVAATKVYKGNSYTTSAPYEYFKSRESVERPLMNEKTYKMLEDMFLMLQNCGEDITCFKIRRWLVKC